nr:hypothetical protein [Stygiolobus azoricus]
MEDVGYRYFHCPSCCNENVRDVITVINLKGSLTLLTALQMRDVRINR